VAASESGLIELSAPGEPLHRLARDVRDRFEVAIVMQQGRAVYLGNRCDQEVDRCRAPMLAPLRERRLNPCRRALAAIVKT
jgi:hypothetical protein